MKKIYNVLVVALVVALSVVGCNVDEDYDLSKFSEGEIGIGTDESSFDLPLAVVTFNVENLINSNTAFASATKAESVMYDDVVYDDVPYWDGEMDGDIYIDDEEGFDDPFFDELFGDDESTSTDSGTIASDLLSKVSDLIKFLPSSYEDGIELSMLSDEVYTTELIDALLTELSEDDDKRADFCEFMVDSAEDYPSVWESLEEALPDTDLTNVDEFTEALGDLLTDVESVDIIDDIKTSVVETVTEETADFETSFVIEETFSNTINLDDATIDMIDSNLDGYKNTLSILFQLTTDLPVSMTFVPYIVLSDGTRILLGDYDDLESAASSITADNFRDMLSQLSIEIEVEFGTYNPSEGDLDLASKTLTIKLIARKTGSLKL